MLFALFPCPKTFIPEFIPISRVIGPLTTKIGPTDIVVAKTPCILNSSVQIVSRAAITTGKNSGLQPAITAFIAIFSIVHSIKLGGTEATISSAVLVVPSSIFLTLSVVGGTTGRPSVHDRSNMAS